MKMNAFLRLIRTIACGVVVLGASQALGQVIDGDATYGTLQPADENGNEIYTADGANVEGDASEAQTLTQGASQEVVESFDSSAPSPYYPPGTEIPLTETEIPGSSYFVGPNGERIDASTLLNQVPAGQETEVPSDGLGQEFSSGQSFSPYGVYDGTLSFPMGTFPTEPFGERILSEVPAGESSAGEIPGALVDESGKPVEVDSGDGETPGMENGVPVDQVVRPDNSPAPEEAKSVAVIEDSSSGSLAEAASNTAGDAPGELAAPKTTQKQSSTADDKAAAKPAAEEKLASRHNRIKQRLQDALGEKNRLDGLLRKANQKTKTLTNENNKLKAAVTKLEEETLSELEGLKKDLKKSKADSQKTVEELKAKLETVQAEREALNKQMKSAENGAQAEAGDKIKALEKKLKQAQLRNQKSNKAMQTAKRDALKKLDELTAANAKATEMAEAAQQELKETKARLKSQLADAESAVAKAQQEAAQAEARIAAAEANVEAAKAEASALAQKMAAGSAAAGIAASGAAKMANAPAADATGAVASAATDVAKKAQDAKAIAQREVNRKLKALEKRKKATEAAEDAAAGDGKKEKSIGKQTVLSLDDQIKQLKAKRDQQIAESETRIRARQQKEIDELIKEGKAVDSKEVRAAVDSMKDSIQTSEAKLRSRFNRKLERLKEEMKSSSK